MGSSPSSEQEQTYSKQGDHKSRPQPANIKESLKLLKNRPKTPQEDINPEQASEQDLQNEPHKEPIRINDNRKEHRQREAPPKGNPQDFEAIARSNIPKNALSSGELEDEEQNSQPSYRNHPRKEQHRPTRREHLRHSEQQEEEEAEVHHERIKMRHLTKHQNEEDYLHNSSIITKPHRKQEGKPHPKDDPHHKEDIDYRQFDSAHIRHKAMREVHQQEHPIKPMHSQQATYEHQQLYPKLLKNYHHEPESHFVKKHEQNSKEHEQHKINVFKRHRNSQHQESHQEEEQEPVPSPHPNFKIHKTEKDLQRSMEVRENYEEEPKAHGRAKRQSNEPEPPRDRRQSQNSQNFPRNADFKKRKESNPPELEKGKQKLQEMEEKSIADLNKENELEATEYEVDPAQLITCRQGCGRKFHANRIKKHEAICRDVFQKKREAFNAQQHRIISKEQKKLMKKNQTDEKKKEKDREGNIPKWKAMSIALRAHVKMGMDENYRPTREEAEMLSQEHHIDVVNCEFCGRNFNKNAAKSHIPFCKAQYQKQIEKERFQKPRGRH